MRLSLQDLRHILGKPSSPAAHLISSSSIALAIQETKKVIPLKEHEADSKVGSSFEVLFVSLKTDAN